MVYGMVDRPLVFTMQDLMQLPSVSGVYFIECNANVPNRRGKTVQDTHGKIACSEWTGVPLSVLLKEAGVRAGAGWILAEGAEPTKHAKSVPMAKAMADVLVAYGQNGEPVRPHNGYPLRLVVPGFEGIYQVKWVRRIRVVDRPFLSFWEQSRFIAKNPNTRHFIFELGPKSVITCPSGGQQLPGRGSLMIRGYAWTGYGAVRRVEVSTDGGKTWNDARLLQPLLRHALTRFELPWTWKGGEAELQSRCTDEAGNVQPTAAAFAKFWSYDLDRMQPDSTQLGHVNIIQPWRVANDGSVQNAL
jgi:sulfane dehydrogenase subunit SoxC